jgi:limonene-1,2-epoxide hydrolase
MLRTLVGATAEKGGTAMGGQQEAVVRSLFGALEADDLGAVLDHFAPDATYHVCAWHEPITGHAAIRAEFERQFTIISGLQVAIGKRVSVDESVFIERVDTFTMGGETVSLHAASAFDFNAQHMITGWRDYYDTGELTAQLSG